MTRLYSRLCDCDDIKKKKQQLEGKVTESSSKEII